MKLFYEKLTLLNTHTLGQEKNAWCLITARHENSFLSLELQKNYYERWRLKQIFLVTFTKVQYKLSIVMIFPNVNFPECGQVEKCELAIPKYED